MTKRKRSRHALLAKSVRHLSADALRSRPRRTESIKLRVTAEQKADWQDVAIALGMTLSELITQVVEHALPTLRYAEHGGTVRA